jgi:flagellar hook-basal body complex protein FliE
MSVAGLGAIKPIAIPSIDDAASPRTNKVDLGSSFANVLKDAHGAENTATDAAEKFAKGDPGMGIHEVMIASEKANIELRYATTLKNKALEAYRELMNTQV